MKGLIFLHWKRLLILDMSAFSSLDEEPKGEQGMPIAIFSESRAEKWWCACSFHASITQTIKQMYVWDQEMQYTVISVKSAHCIKWLSAV